MLAQYFTLIFMVNPQNCCARRTISQNNRTVISTAVQFSQGISPHRGRGKPNRYLFLFCTFYWHFNFRLSFIGSESERSLPRWGGTQNSEVRKQQSFVSSAYIVYSEYLTATADDHMKKWTGSGLFISSGWSGDFTLLLHSGYVLELIQIHNWIYKMCWIVDVTENCLIAYKTILIDHFFFIFTVWFINVKCVCWSLRFYFVINSHFYCINIHEIVYSHTNKVQK